MPKTIKMPSADDIKTAYVGSASRASTAYTKGVDANTDAMDRAKSDAAEGSFNAAMTTVLANKLRQKGLADVTQEEWKTKAKTLGAPRLGTGIAAAGDSQKAGFEPYRSALSGLSLPDKVPDDPLGNLQRNAGKVVATLANIKRREKGLAEVPVP